MASPDFDNQNNNFINQASQANSNHVGEEESMNTEKIASFSAPTYDIDSGELNNSSSPNQTNNLNSSTMENGESSEETSESTTWSVPFDLDAVSTASDIKKYIFRLARNASDVKTIITESKDITGDFDKMDLDTEAIMGMFGIINDKYQGDEEVEASDIEKLQKASDAFEASFGGNFNNIKNQASGSLSNLKQFQKINTESNEIKDAMQTAYYNGDYGLADKLSKMLDTAEEYNEKGATMIGLASDNIAYVKDSKLLDMLGKGCERIGNLVGKAKETLDVAIYLETLYNDLGGNGNRLGGATSSLSSIMESVDKVINFVDLPGLNILQSIWNHVYKPMIDSCITGLYELETGILKGGRDITGIRIIKWKESQIGEGNTAPPFMLDAMNAYYEGGWEVFYFMWNVMCGNIEFPNETVVQYFEDNYDRINAGAGSEIALPYHWKLSWYIDPEQLFSWSVKTKYKLWSMFYGSGLPIPPGTK